MAGERVKLEAQERESTGTSASARLRREGFIPGVLYGRGKTPHAIAVPERELRGVLTGPHGRHAILDVVLEGQKTSHASILKDFQVDPIRGRITHFDLHEVRLDEAITAQVAIELTGESPGVKVGGVLSALVREVSVEALPLFARHFRDLGLTGEGVVSVSPDTGRAKQAERFAEMIESEFAIMHKSRPAPDVAALTDVVTEIAGRVGGKRAIIGDDVIMTGGTMKANVRALEEHGATEVWLFATHGVFCGTILEEFAADDGIKGIVVTDTVPIDPLRRPDKLTVLPVSNLLAETIMNVFADDSVSAIFGGENQLF